MDKILNNEYYITARNNLLNSEYYAKAKEYIITTKDKVLSEVTDYSINTKDNVVNFYSTNMNDISNNPDILNPFKFPINNNKIYNKDYNILLPHKFKVQNSTFFYILYFLILIFSIIKYVNLN